MELKRRGQVRGGGGHGFGVCPASGSAVDITAFAVATRPATSLRLDGMIMVLLVLARRIAYSREPGIDVAVIAATCERSSLGRASDLSGFFTPTPRSDPSASQIRCTTLWFHSQRNFLA